MKVRPHSLAFAFVLLVMLAPLNAYENFKVAVYTRAYETAKMADPAWLEERWTRISQQLHVDKIYLETHRDGVIVDDATLEKAKKFFTDRGVQVAGGITYTIDEPNRFETFCYTNPLHRAKAKLIAEYTAKHFDEIILDDFFFTSCKCDLCVKARGNRSWQDYRLQLMTEAARDLIVGPAKAVNPKVRVIIKYPNWYDHFQSCGFNQKDEPAIFDGIHTGTESRNADVAAQHLQPYHSYSIIRYFENIAPGRNGGGWVDTYGCRYMDRYAEQLWLTLFAKAREMTLFDFRLIDEAIPPQSRGPWQGQGTSFDFDAMMAPFKTAEGKTVKPSTYARAVAISCDAVDKVVGKLGNPIGLKSYKPYYSSGEAFLQSFLGMAGIPIEMVTSFPSDESIVLLTAQAADDPEIMTKIENQLRAKKSVVITSGLLKALHGRGIEHIAEIELSGRVASVNRFVALYHDCKGSKPILIPQITYRTNDSWELVSGIDGDNGWPILHDADYAGGHLFVLTIPENFSDISELPEPALSAIHRTITAHLPVQLEAPGKVSLFVYDNGTFIVESFRDEPVDVKVTIGLDKNVLEDLSTGEIVSTEVRNAFKRWDSPPAPEKRVASFKLPAHSFRAFRIK